MFKLKQVNPGAPHKQDRVYQVDGLSPCLGANSGGGQMPYIEVRQATKNGSIAVKSGGGRYSVSKEQNKKGARHR